MYSSVSREIDGTEKARNAAEIPPAAWQRKTFFSRELAWAGSAIWQLVR
jgi:hypothetical protein